MSLKLRYLGQRCRGDAENFVRSEKKWETPEKMGCPISIGKMGCKVAKTEKTPD